MFSVIHIIIFFNSRGYTLQGKKLYMRSLYKLEFIRAYSTTQNNDSSADLVVDADKDKLEILKYVNSKSGIYMWTNKLNGNKYVGSSIDLRRRLLEYYNVKRLLNEKSMNINVALLKYGYHNFSLTILELCGFLFIKKNIILKFIILNIKNSR